jgi:xylan 1,4-beta-xylosidase
MLKRRDLVGAGGTLLALSALGGAAKAETPSEAIEIELRRDIGKLDHIWKRCVGSDRAEITMRESWRKDARRGRQELGLERVRFHAASSTTNWGSGSSAATTRRGSSARPTNTVRTR